MSIFNEQKKDKTKESLLFLPYHHPAIFDRTFKATENCEGLVCVILCVTLLEAYINDIVSFYTYFSKNAVTFHENDHPTNYYLSDIERSILESLVNAERKNILEKFCILGDWNRSDKIYQDFKEIIRIRNNIVHLKPEEIVICKESGKVNGYPLFLNNFFQNGIINKTEKVISWIELIETREFCLWCQNAAYQVIQKSTNMLPNSNIQKHFQKETHFFYDIKVCRNRYSEKT